VSFRCGQEKQTELSYEQQSGYKYTDKGNSVSDILNVEKRDTTGTLRIRRMRQAGMIPAVLYGHGKETISLTVSGKELDNVIRLGHHVVALKGGVNESALIKDIQWDPLGSDVLHLDLSRITAGELVQVMLPVELKGVAPGTKSGGTLRFLRHELEIECPADKLTDKLEVNINHLELEQSITAGQVELPPAATLVSSPEDVVVQCVVVEEQAEIEPGEEGAESAEPEIIGRKKEDEEVE